MPRKQELVRENSTVARRKWPEQTNRTCIHLLEALTRSFGFSIASGDLIFLNGWYVTHAGLLRLARRSRCFGIHVEPVPDFSSMAASRWAFKATVFRSRTCRGFVGYGDADPSNVSSLVHGAEMRVAETRAVNRALRKAYGIGICSVEESRTHSTLSVEEAPAPAGRWKERKLRWPQGPRPPLPADPPAPARCQPRQVLCGRFLRHQDPPRSDP
jgi:hypothetical protein